MLRVIPERGDGVAVEVSHDFVRYVYVQVAAKLKGRDGEKIIHQAEVKRGLLVSVVVVLIAKSGLCAREPVWIDAVGIAAQKRSAHTVYSWRRGIGIKDRLAG